MPTYTPGTQRKAVPFHVACDGDNAPLICGDALPIFAAIDYAAESWTVDTTGSVGEYVRIVIGSEVGDWVANTGTVTINVTGAQEAEIVDGAVITLQVSNDGTTPLASVTATVYTGTVTLSTTDPTSYNSPVAAGIPACGTGTAAYTEFYDTTATGTGTATIAGATGIVSFSSISAGTYYYYAYRKCDGVNVNAVLLVTGTAAAL